ncbi:MAG TPA: hypothetical protein VF265_07415 [Nevskiaceae bacterium]
MFSSSQSERGLRGPAVAVGVALLTALVLAGCASQPAKAPAPLNGMQATYQRDAGVGVPLQTLAPAQVDNYLGSEATALEQTRAASPVNALWSPPQKDSASLSLRLDAARWFEFGSGELRLEALEPGAQLAAVIERYRAQVVWVVGYGADGGVYSLAARRAASVAAQLERRGVPRARLRFISRADADGRQPGIEIVLVALRTGAVPAAYVPPA